MKRDIQNESSRAGKERTMIAGFPNNQIRRRVSRWLAGTAPSAGLLGRSAHPETSDAASRLDPTAAREANRDAIEFALRAGYSGFIRIPAVDSLDEGGEVYDSPHNQLPDARTLAESASVAGELSGDSGFTSDASQSVDQAARSVGPAGME
jgi:hypothetical protein